MEIIKNISDVITTALAVGFILIMIVGLAINSHKIKRIEDKMDVDK